VPASSSRRIRTGLFEIDLVSGEVYKDGRKVSLQEQPFRVLAVLLESPGETVTREELQSRLWPADTYVGFDEGLNTAIRKLRVAFGDSAENPRFFQTIPRRGYRFIAPLHEVPGSLQTEETVDDLTASSSRPPSPSFKTPVILISAAILLLLLCMAGFLAYRRSSRSPVSMKRVMLAILPFQNLSNDPLQEYFSDGLTEETITDLGQVSPEHLGVIARTSAMAYKHTSKTVDRIGKELGVDYVLEGSVRREGGKARVSVQLIRVSDQTHLWARNYDLELHDVLEIESQLGNDIAQRVQVNLAPRAQNQLSKMRSVDPEAYDLYLKGRFYWNQRNPAAIKESIGYLLQATNKDPNFALAYAALADAYNFTNIVGLYSPKESFPEAKAAATKAISLDPMLAEAHAALGMEKSHFEFDFPGAEREFLKAIELNPSSAYAHLFYSNCYLSPMGRTSEAIVENKRALELDPLSLPINNFMAITYVFAGDYEHAYRQFQATIAMDPTFGLAHESFASYLTETGKFEEAIQEYEKAKVVAGANPEQATAEAATMRAAFKAGGAKLFWQRSLELILQSMQRPEQGFVAADIVAGAYARVGARDKAFEWLDKAYEERDGADLALLKVDPAWNNIRSDPRFADLLQRLGLPK